MSHPYINPVDLLNLAGLPAASLDATTIKKARRRLIADLELDGNALDYQGQRIDRSACERACADLDEPERLRVWHRLANLPTLNEFLGSGRTDFLLNPVSTASLTSDTELVRVVGSRYAEQYDKALLAAFRSKNVAQLQQVAAAPALYPPSESRRAHQGVSRLLREKVTAIREQTETLDEDDDEKAELSTLTRTLTSIGWPSMVNALPTAAYNGVRTELVLAVRNFAIHYFNAFFEPAPSLKLLQEAATVPTDGQTADRLREDLQQIREIEKQQQVRARMDAVAERFGQAFEQLLAHERSIEIGLGNMYAIKQWATGLGSLITELNPMTEPDIVAARDALAMGLRGLAVSIWNKDQSNGATALQILNTGLALRISAATSAKLTADKTQLTRLMSPPTRSYTPPPSKPNSSNGSGISGWLWVLGTIVLLAFLLNTCGMSSSSSTSSSSASTDYATTSQDTATERQEDAADQLREASDADVDNSTTVVTPPYVIPESQYKGNQLKNGASPLDNCFGKGRYAGPSWITFKNENNDTDAIVCLARTSDNKVIRNEYIRAGTSFRMSRIPAGTYYLKVFYGEDWNPTRRNDCGTKGCFDTNQRFSQSREYTDLVTIQNDGYSYTTGTMTLYTVAGGNMAQQPINAAEFFGQ